MPGYGENMPEHFVQSAEKYIMTRHEWVRKFKMKWKFLLLNVISYSLRSCIVLVDGEQGLSEADKVGLEMMQECSRPYAVSSAFNREKLHFNWVVK